MNKRENIPSRTRLQIASGLAMGRFSISLRGYTRFARLYLNERSYNGEQILPREWVKDSMDVSAEYSKRGRFP